MRPAEVSTDVLVNLFKVLSKPDALEIFLLASGGIENSTHAIEELGFTSKRYYARLRELVDMGFVSKKGGIYRQTPFGSMIYSRLLPAMGRAYESRDRLSLITKFKGTEIEDDVRELLEEELDLPDFVRSHNVNMLETYEDLAIEAVDLYDSAEESVILASNYFDVRVMEAFLRALDRGISVRVIMGKTRRSSKLHNLRMMLSITFTKELLNFASNTVNLKNTVRFADLPYTFCVVDGHHNILDISNTINETFIVALSIDNSQLSERLIDFYEMIWKDGDFYSAIEALNYLKSS